MSERSRNNRGRGGPRRQSRFPVNTPPVDVTIDRIGGQGDGVARAIVGSDWEARERQIFVPFTLPGERVLARPVRDKGEGVACEPTELASTSSERADPPCRHFMTCGGCALQHWEAPPYQAWKRGRVTEALDKVGLGDVDVSDMAAAGPMERRRADIVLRRLDGRILAGFRERASNRIVDLRQCPVLVPELFEMVGALRLLAQAFLAPGEDAAAAMTMTDDGIDLLLDLPREPDMGLLRDLADFADRTDCARLSWRASGGDQPATPLAARRSAAIRFGALAVKPPPGGFLQATRRGENAIADAVLAGVGEARRVADLFAGCGTLSGRLLMRKGRMVHAVEGLSAPLEAATRAASEAGLSSRFTTEKRDLSSRPLAGKELNRFDAVVFDPPRAGAKPQAEALAVSGVPSVVAVSCNPSTFARDARILVDGGYNLLWCRPIDQFLWSPHVELVAAFRKA